MVVIMAEHVTKYIFQFSGFPTVPRAPNGGSSILDCSAGSDSGWKRLKLQPERQPRAQVISESNLEQ